MRITKSVVDRLAPNSFAWDSGLIGFGVRRQLRSAFYLVRYRVGGKQRYYTIGRHGELAPDQARKEAQRLLGEIASGKPRPKSRPIALARCLSATLPMLARGCVRGLWSRPKGTCANTLPRSIPYA